MYGHFTVGRKDGRFLWTDSDMDLMPLADYNIPHKRITQFEIILSSLANL